MCFGIVLDMLRASTEAVLQNVIKVKVMKKGMLRSPADLLATWRTRKANWMLRVERWAPSVPKWKLKLRSSRWADPVLLSWAPFRWLAAKLLMSQKLFFKSVIAVFPSCSQSNLGAQAVLQAEAKHIDLQVPLMVGVSLVAMRCQTTKKNHGTSKRETSRNIS